MLWSEGGLQYIKQGYRTVVKVDIKMGERLDTLLLAFRSYVSDGVLWKRLYFIFNSTNINKYTRITTIPRVSSLLLECL